MTGKPRHVRLVQDLPFAIAGGKAQLPCVSFVLYDVALFIALPLFAWSFLDARVQIPACRPAGHCPRLPGAGRDSRSGTGASADFG
ncbi:hypothetical protein EMIT0347P_10728 [Pseudomonas sp. IT-347P]